MKRLVKGLLGLLLLGWIATFAGSLVYALRLKREAPPPPDESSDYVELAVAFDQLDFRSTASQFAGGRVECAFGGGTLDLRDATLADGPARLEGRAIFGGAQIVVPEDWRVTVHSTAIFGGVGDARGRKEYASDAPHLEIEAFALFGGFGITSATN